MAAVSLVAQGQRAPKKEDLRGPRFEFAAGDLFVGDEPRADPQVAQRGRQRGQQVVLFGAGMCNARCPSWRRFAPDSRPANKKWPPRRRCGGRPGSTARNRCESPRVPRHRRRCPAWADSRERKHSCSARHRPACRRSAPADRARCGCDSRRDCPAPRPGATRSSSDDLPRRRSGTSHRECCGTGRPSGNRGPAATSRCR